MPELAAGASAVHEVASGRVDEVAASLRPGVLGETLVALGGGRIIDTAKALASADPPRRVVAIPTTLSGAEMTPVHRQAAGVDPATRGVRPALVINDPALSASQPLADLAASAIFPRPGVGFVTNPAGLLLIGSTLFILVASWLRSSKRSASDTLPRPIT